MEQKKGQQYTAFAGTRLIGRGELYEAVRLIKGRLDDGEGERIALYDDETGYTLDINYEGTMEEVLSRLSHHPLVASAREEGTRRAGPGRPKLGVVAREVTLLPRHWEWLNEQPGGASAAMRRLVEEARRSHRTRDMARRAQEATHRFMWDMAGDMPHFEEASRAFYRGNTEDFAQLIQDWPPDVRDHLLLLAERVARLAPAPENPPGV